MGGVCQEHCFPFSPPRGCLTWTPGELTGLSQHFSSFVRIHSHTSFPTPAGFLTGSDSLPESGFYLRGEQGKRYQVIPSRRRQPLCLSPSSYLCSCLPFTMSGTSDSVLPITTEHITLLLQGAKHHHTMLSYSTRQRHRKHADSFRGETC